MKRSLFIAAALILITLLLFTGCGKGGETSTEATAGDSTASPTESGVDFSQTDTGDNGETEVTTPVTRAEDGFIPITTPYGDLLFPEEMSDALDTEVEDDGEGSCRVSFYANINGSRYPLYVLSIGSGDGDEVGTLTGPDGTARSVYLTVFENDVSGVSDNEALSVYAMQETLNEVISNLG